MTHPRFLADAAALRRLLGSDLRPLQDAFTRALGLLTTALRGGGKILAMGNGGSAADAEHLVAELVGRFGYDRASLPGLALTAPSPTFTAIANDYGFEQVFARQVRGFGRPGDVVFAISTSGNSPNVLRAVEAARELGLPTIGLTGGKDSQLAALAEVTLRVPSAQTPRIQEIHALLIHSLCRGIEEDLFPREGVPALPAGKLVPPDRIDDLARAITPFRSVFTNGCFDVLHPGHVALLQDARATGDLLVLGLNTDESVRRLKGPSRPLHAFAERAAVLAALEAVDFVVGFGEDTPLELIRRLSPKVLVKGGDYTRDTIVGADWVETHGGEVKVFPLLGSHSTTRILQGHGGKRDA